MRSLFDTFFADEWEIFQMTNAVAMACVAEERMLSWRINFTKYRAKCERGRRRVIGDVVLVISQILDAKKLKKVGYLNIWSICFIV